MPLTAVALKATVSDPIPPPGRTSQTLAVAAPVAKLAQAENPSGTGQTAGRFLIDSASKPLLGSRARFALGHDPDEPAREEMFLAGRGCA